jgi:putative hydrolase of HD superfamily
VSDEPTPTEEETRAAARFVFEQGLLKRAKRTGWWHVGVSDPESIAEHAYRTAIIGAVLAGMEGADAARVALMCVLHDSQETRVGDVPHIGRCYLDTASNSAVTADQVQGMPPQTARLIQSTVDSYEAQDCLEAQVARDADKLDCLVQAIEYGECGYANVGPWIESSRAKLATPGAKALAEAALSMSSQEWWQYYLARQR